MKNKIIGFLLGLAVVYTPAFAFSGIFGVPTTLHDKTLDGGELTGTFTGDPTFSGDITLGGKLSSTTSCVGAFSFRVTPNYCVDQTISGAGQTITTSCVAISEIPSGIYGKSNGISFIYYIELRGDGAAGDETAGFGVYTNSSCTTLAKPYYASAYNTNAITGAFFRLDQNDFAFKALALSDLLYVKVLSDTSGNSVMKISMTGYFD